MAIKRSKRHNTSKTRGKKNFISNLQRINEPMIVIMQLIPAIANARKDWSTIKKEFQKYDNITVKSIYENAKTTRKIDLR